MNAAADHLATFVCYGDHSLPRMPALAAASAWLRTYNVIANNPNVLGEAVSLTEIAGLDCFDEDEYHLVAYVNTQSGAELVLYLDTDGNTPRIMCRALRSADRLPQLALAAAV